MAILVRPAREDELRDVGTLTLDAYAVDGFVTPESPYAATLRDAAARAREAELYAAVDEEGTLLGTVTYCPEGSPYQEVAREGEGEFRMLAVSGQARRRGVAQALVRTCLRRSSELGYTAVALSSMPGQRPAHRLYERLGFRRAPELDWRPHPETPLLGFRLNLIPPAG